MRPPTICALLCSLLASTALAQAPVTTTAGDPSVRNDTIYALAVKPADYPEEQYVFLLDDGVVRLEADGRGTRTFRQVAQILTQDGVESWGELRFSYSGSREKLTVNWARVLRPDGTVVSARPTHEQESEVPAALEYPVYSDTKVHRATLGGLAPGLLVDYSYTVETLQPVMPGDFFASWSVTTGRPTERSRFILDVPASLTPRIRERNISFERQMSVAHGRRVYEWATAHIPKPPVPEPFASDSNGVYAGLAVASPLSWADVARWYAGLVRDRYTVTPALDARLADLVKGAATGLDSLRAVHRWVAQDFRYVSVALGLAGYQPREPAAILETMYGDCKDKATLFVALAQRMGFHAYPVLLSASGGIDSLLPSARQFDHMIAAVERPEGYLYLDLTADEIPIGQLPAPEYGAFALIVHPDGRGEAVTLPLDSASANGATNSLVGTLSPEGVFAGRMTTTLAGRLQVGLRQALSHTITARQREEFARGLANGLFEGAVGDSLELFDGRDLSATPRISVVIRDAKATSPAGTGSILRLPMRPLFSSELVANLESHVPRKFPISVAAVIGPAVALEEYRITLPQGWRARLPAGVTASSAYGEYRSTYTQDGRELRVERRAEGARGIQPPEKVADLIAFIRAIAQDDPRLIMLEHP
jgi:transglutaminase-like putative cysteine protease